MLANNNGKDAIAIAQEKELTELADYLLNEKKRLVDKLANIMSTLSFDPELPVEIGCLIAKEVYNWGEK